MNPSIWLKRATPALSLIALLILSPEVSPKPNAVSPARDAGSSGVNTARRQNPVFSPEGGGWNVVPSPNTGHPHNYFYGVAAITSGDVWAVGGHGNLTTHAQQLIQHWDGQNWTVATTPVLPTIYNELLAVSAVSTNDVWAVGSSGGEALIEHWDGTSWSVVPHPNPGIGNRFFGVAAVASNNVWAVGYTSDGGLSQTLVEHWDGNNWSVIPSPNVPDQHNSLFAVAAVPGTNELWAVGRADPSTPFILHWNGTQWSIVPGPPSGTVPLLYGVAAVSTNDVWAVGWTGGKSGPVTLTMHWDGSKWSVVPSPNPSSTSNYLHGVTALATNDVWAVGEFNAPGGNQRTLFLRWNGTTWEQFQGDNTGPNGVQFFTNAVSAINGSDIWAVGTNSHTLAEHWNGTSWSMASTPNAGTGDNILNAVSGTASTDVWEVGYYQFGTWKQTLIEHWNGANWSIVPSPNPNNRLNELHGVVAISPSNAWAVGSSSSGNVPDQTTLILHWDGMDWSIIPSPSPGSGGQNILYAVDANSANDVWAVGSYTHVGEFAQTLVAHWDGASWSVIPSANVPGAFNELYGVVALAPNNVWAVGYWGHASFGFSTLIEHWDGSSWSIMASPNPSGDNFLSSVSATGANDIWAIGRSRNPFNFMTTTLIEHWDGNSWTQVLGFGVEPESAGYGVAAVSPGDAWGVGDGGGLALIGRWNGSSWSAFPSPQVPGRLLAATAITPCDVWAVGLQYVEGVGFLTLSEHFISQACGTPSPTPTPTATPTATPTPPPPPTPTPTSTPTPSPSPTATATPTATPNPTSTPTPTPPSASPYDFNHDSRPDFVLYRASTRQTAIWYMHNNVFAGGAFGPILPSGWSLIDVADFNRDGNNDYALFNSATRQTAIWYLSGTMIIGSAWGPPVPIGWTLVATGDFSGDGKPDFVIYKPSTGQTGIWYLNNNVYIGGGFGPTLPAGWRIAGVADFNGNGTTDYDLFKPSTRQSGIYYLLGTVYAGSAFGPTIASGYELTGTADFNGNGKPDDVLFNITTRQTAFYYLNNNVYVGSALGPVLPAGWSLAAP
jgi:hypothetical protein